MCVSVCVYTRNIKMCLCLCISTVLSQHFPVNVKMNSLIFFVVPESKEFPVTLEYTYQGSYRLCKMKFQDFQGLFKHYFFGFN